MARSRRNSQLSHKETRNKGMFRINRRIRRRLQRQAAKSQNQRQSYRDDERQPSISERRARLSKSNTGRDIHTFEEVQDTPLAGTQVNRCEESTDTPQRRRTINWLTVCSVVITAATFISAVVYAYARFEAKVQGNSDEITATKEEIKDLNQKITNMRERLAKLEVRAELVDTNKQLAGDAEKSGDETIIRLKIGNKISVGISNYGPQQFDFVPVRERMKPKVK